MAHLRTRAARAIPDEALRRALMADSECGLLLADPSARVAALNVAGARILSRTRQSAEHEKPIERRGAPPVVRHGRHGPLDVPGSRRRLRSFPRQRSPPPYRRH